uniref:Uncharacterized protein n=1 Tax=Arundo donax TaxID=35708 RepID=A0A0A9BDS2_ARUDO
MTQRQMFVSVVRLTSVTRNNNVVAQLLIMDISVTLLLSSIPML